MATNRTGKRGRKPYRAGRVQPKDEMHLMAPFRDKEGEGVFSSPPLAHTLMTLIGCVVEVQMCAGEVLEGVLEAVSPNMDITLRVAHVKGESPTRENVQDRKEVNFSDVVTISATTGSNPQLGNIFKTDNEISSRSNGPQSRELQPFTDFSNEDNPDLSLSNSKESGWSVEDMWDVNQTKFNVSSKFDEEMSQYTTQLDRTDSDVFKQRELRALKLAGEIEGVDMFSRHSIDDSGTEEERFSAVSRPTATSKPDRPLTNQIISAAQENIRHPTTAISPLPSSTPPHFLPTTTHTLTTSTPSTSAGGGTGTDGNHSDGNHGNGDHGNLPQTADVREDETNGVDSSEGAVRTNGGENPLIMDTNEVESPSSLSEAAMDPSTGEKVQTPVGTEQKQPTEQGNKVTEKAEEEEEEDGGGSKENQIKESSKTEIAIKEFKLDPKAKEFVLDPTASTFVPSSIPVSRTSPSPSSVHTSPSSSSSSSTYHLHTLSHSQPHTRTSRYLGHKSPRNHRGHTPTQVYTSPTVFPEHMLQAAVSSGYVLAQQQAASGMFRPGMLQQGFQQYAVPPNPMMAGVMVHGGLPNPQIITANPHAQMMAGGGQQLFNMVPQQTQFLAQPGQQIFTPQGVISSAQGGLYLPGVTAHTPHSSLQQQQVLAAAAAVVPQPMGQQIVATAAPASLSQRMFQIPGAGN